MIGLGKTSHSAKYEFLAEVNFDDRLVNMCYDRFSQIWTGFGKTKNILSFWYQIEELAPENAPKSYSFPLQSYECFKNHFC